jgi:hypothetical protein
MPGPHSARNIAVVVSAAVVVLALAIALPLILGGHSANGAGGTRDSATGHTGAGPAASARRADASKRVGDPKPSGAAAGTPSAGRPGAAAGGAGVSGGSSTGFWSGTDSWPVPVSGLGPFREPQIGASYGGYIGMAGNWARWSGCGGKIAWSSADSRAANINYARYHKGIGTGVYWYAAGPGVDPHYNGTTAEAYAWGQQQAAATLRAVPSLHVKYPVIFMDIELPQIAPAPDNGWNSAYTSACSGRVTGGPVSPAVDRADFNGFDAYISSHSSYKTGVYSAPPVWKQIFGTGPAGRIPHTDEWTYTANTTSLARPPDGWCVPGTSTCAHFFGGVTARDPQALMWQWTGGGGASNGVGDFNQIDVSRQP